MNILQNLKRIIYSFDLFCSSELLRYKEDTKYKTLSGGLLSLGIIIVITIGFAGMITDTFDKTSITSDLTNIKQADPTPLKLTANSQNNFMFGVGITSLETSFRANLSATKKYFNVYFLQEKFEFSHRVSETLVPLVQCTPQHWGIIPEADFDSYTLSTCLCPPLNYSYTLRGSLSSPKFDFLQILFRQCVNSSYDNSCAPQEEIDQIFLLYVNFVVNILYINPVINPNQPDGISYYAQFNDYATFSKSTGSLVFLEFADYTINTDSSMLPFSNMIVDTGAIAQTKSTSHTIVFSNGLLVSLNIAKSSNSLVYNRQVQKISAVFSYIGGLVGAVTALLFMIKSYTDISFEITIGIDLFESQDNEKNSQPPQFNLICFIKLSVYRVLKFLKWKGRWKSAEKFQAYQNEAVKQLNISILLRRLFLLQTCINRLIPKEELDKVKNDEKETINLRTAKKMRDLHVKDQRKKTIHIEQYSEDPNNNQVIAHRAFDRVMTKTKMEEKLQGSSYGLTQQQWRFNIQNKKVNENNGLNIVKKRNELYFLTANNINFKNIKQTQIALDQKKEGPSKEYISSKGKLKFRLESNQLQKQ